MTPTEKALELYQKFRHKVGEHKGDEGEIINDYLSSKKVAVLSALICAKENFDLLDGMIDLELSEFWTPDDAESSRNGVDEKYFWEEVINELIKLQNTDPK